MEGTMGLVETVEAREVEVETREEAERLDAVDPEEETEAVEMEEGKEAVATVEVTEAVETEEARVEEAREVATEEEATEEGRVEEAWVEAKVREVTWAATAKGTGRTKCGTFQAKALCGTATHCTPNLRLRRV